MYENLYTHYLKCCVRLSKVQVSSLSNNITEKFNLIKSIVLSLLSYAWKLNLNSIKWSTKVCLTFITLCSNLVSDKVLG